MPRGRKYGGGSRKGIPNKATAPFRERLRAMLDEMDADPFKYMASVVVDVNASPELRARAATMLSKYLEPELRSTDVTVSGNPDAPLVVRIRRRGDK